MLDKTRLIEAIQQLNRSARREWLDSFAKPALRQYLEHLETVLEPRGSRWTREDGRPAIVTRTPCW